MPLSKLSNNAMYTSLLHNTPKATATKLSGAGKAPGMPAVGNSGVPANTPAYSANTGSTPTFTATAGAAPQLSNASSGGGVAHGDPRDPTYWTDVAKIQNTFGTNDTSYNTQQTQGQTALDSKLGELDKQEPIDKSNASGSYNNSGLLYSTRLTGALGDIASQFGTQRTNARTGFTNLVNNLNILRNQNQNENGRGPNGELTGTNYLDALNSGIGRSASADQAAAQANLLAGLNADGTPKAGAAPAGQPGQMVNGQFVSGGITSPSTAALINQWIQQAGKNKKPSTGSLWSGAAGLGK